MTVKKLSTLLLVIVSMFVLWIGATLAQIAAETIQTPRLDNTCQQVSIDNGVRPIGYTARSAYSHPCEWVLWLHKCENGKRQWRCIKERT